MSCPFIKRCPVFSAAKHDPDQSYLTWAFCRTVYADCGRYKTIISGRSVPEGLMPTGEVVGRAGTVQPLKRIG